MTTEYQRRAERNHRRDCVHCQLARERLLRSALDVYVACESLAYDVTDEERLPDQLGRHQIPGDLSPIGATESDSPAPFRRREGTDATAVSQGLMPPQGAPGAVYQERPDVERCPLAAPSGAVPEGDSTPPSGHQRDKETM